MLGDQGRGHVAVAFRTVFDVTQQGLSTYGALPVVALILVSLTALMPFLPSLMWRGWDRLGLPRVAFMLMWSMFAAVFSLVTVRHIVRERTQIREALEQSQYEVTEGEVTNYVPPRWARGKANEESFDVGGKHFSYSDFRATSGFHQTRLYGGPVRPGLHVRVTSLRSGLILRLEVSP